MLNQLTGNQRVKDLLRRMLESRRVPGALLFSGEEGVGKKLFALELAKAINCRARNGVEACGKCPACVRISKINFPTSDEKEELRKIFWTDHPDVGLIQPPTRTFHVEQMRKIEREANYRPFEGVARFFIIDEADKMNEPSANALLKTLEEPPPTSRIILITSRPAVLLPTIRSRCQAIRFAPLRSEEIEEHLIRNNMGKGSEVRLRARSAAGSIGRAVTGDIETYQEQRDSMLKILNALVLTGDLSQLLRASEGINEAAYKDEYETRLDVLQTLIRDAWMLSLGIRNELLVNEDILPHLSKVAAKIDSQRVIRWISEIEELRDQLTVNINRKVATDALFLSMASA